ncbi:autorepressor SdpR family transcription factor [Maritalea sp.]|uniref:autorepressor SdpR family transcription factor n=1 Tax=Maritalea sp. TaxID=2003361 RepID=UPI003EF33D85
MNSVFEALSHPVRRKIVKTLKQGPKSAGELAGMFDLTKPTISSHFAKLKKAELVRTTRQGNSILYHLNASVLETALSDLLDFSEGNKDD